MPFFFGDGWDLYTNPSDAVSGGHWDVSSPNPNSSGLTTGRFSGSRAISQSSSTTWIKTSGVNDSVHHFNFAYVMTQAVSGTTVGLAFSVVDGATQQCTIYIRSDGAMVFTLGNSAGTVLGIWTGAVPARDVWYAFEVEIVVHGTAGSIAIRKNGNPANDYYLGSLNTRVSANNYANGIRIGSSGVSQAFDDFLWRSDVLPVPWVGDIRCYTRMPATDVSVQFSRSTATFSQAFYGQVGVSNGYGANNAFYMRVVAGRSGLVTSASLDGRPGGNTGHIRMALFSATATGLVGDVLAVSNELTNPPAATMVFTFPTPVHVTNGTTYWAGINQDATMNFYVINNPVPLLSLTQTYASWPVSNPGGALGNFNAPGALTFIYTFDHNSDVISETQQDATTSYVYSATNGQADLYGIGTIPVVPLETIGVVTRGYFLKSDAGTRNAAVQVKSGSTVVQSSSVALNTAVWTWLGRVDVVDPATGVAWTAAGVSSLQVGPVVTA